MTHRRSSPRAASRPLTARLVVAAGLLACAPVVLAQRIMPADEMRRLWAEHMRESDEPSWLPK